LSFSNFALICAWNEGKKPVAIVSDHDFLFLGWFEEKACRVQRFTFLTGVELKTSQ